MSSGEMESDSRKSVGSSWSKLPSDLMQLIFARLGFTDFQRAKSVCSSWHYASKRSSPNNQIPWLILFPERDKDYCLLFNIEEKDKLHRVQDLGVNFANSNCLATCESWLLMQDPMYNLYMLNLFTRERIDLPSMKSQLCIIETEQTEDNMFLIRLDNKGDVLFWIDEKTKDYVVIWRIHDYRLHALIYSRKGDKFWKRIEDLDHNFDMVYKDHKLYMYTSYSRDVKVLDFSEDIPRQIFETQLDEWLRGHNLLYIPGVSGWKTKTEHLVIRVTGEFLRVKSFIWDDSDVWSFCIYKIDSSNSEWEKIDSLGDEAILLDLGITILANTIEGVDGNSIYFSGNHSYYDYRDHVWSEKDIFIFNLSTHKVERPHQSICSSIQLSNARWFVPNFKQI